MSTTVTANLSEITFHFAVDIETDVPGSPALPDCGVLFTDPARGEPALRWETLSERDARKHAEWIARRPTP